jgi:hypothetical protein
MASSGRPFIAPHRHRLERQGHAGAMIYHLNQNARASAITKKTPNPMMTMGTGS